MKDRKNEDRRGRASQGETRSTVAPGKITRSSQLPPRRTAGDVAAAAVRGKGAGAGLDNKVSNRVGRHLGADFSNVRVHSDEVSEGANTAMGARAFAHGEDIFLGRGESATDLNLMAHELTHVVQQGAAGKRGPQANLEVEPANSPAEQEADRVADEVTQGSGSDARIVEAEPSEGQLSRDEFLRRLRAEVTSTADDALGPMWSAVGCPYIDQWFERHRDSSAETLERLAKRYSRLVVAPTAEAYIAPICRRVRSGIERWRAGEDVSADVTAAGGDGSMVPSVEQASGPNTVAAKIESFGPSESLPSEHATRLGEAFDDSFSDVEIHTGPEAAAATEKEGAKAMTVGTHVAFAPGEFQPGTTRGDALLAHELAHAQQQREAASDDRAMLQPLGSESAAHEEAADQVAGGALSRLWSRVSGGARKMAKGAYDVARSSVQLQRCSDGGVEPSYEFTPHREGPHVGQRVGALAPGGNMVTQEWVHTALSTIGEAETETEAITIAKVADHPAAIIASDGVFFVYRISFREDIFGNEMSYNPILIANAGLQVDEGVVAIVANANVYRTGYHHGSPSTEATRGAYQETFEPYLGLHDGDLTEASEEEYLAIFQAAMRDNALSVLAESERQAEAKAAQFAGGTSAVTTGEQDTIDEVAREALEVQRSLEEKEAEALRIRQNAGMQRRHMYDHEQEQVAELDAEAAALRTRRREVNLGYPMIGRYETARQLQEFVDTTRSGRISALAGDAQSVLQNIATTRTNILTGSLNLWVVPPIVDSTLAGMRVAEDSDQRRWVTTKAQAQTEADRDAQIALAVLSIGLGLAAAFATGGASLILTAGAVGVGVYDAVRTTEDHFVREAGTDTDIDRIDGASLLPEEMRQHWGWLVLAWVGVGLDAFDVARAIGQAGRLRRSAALIDEAAQSLAAGDARMLERLRRAAGDVDIAETIGETNRAAASRAVGAEIEIDPRAGRSVEVRYEIDPDTGRTVVTGVRAGSAASVGDIVAHADTVRMLRRRGTLVERVHDLWTRIRTFGREGSANPFPTGSAAFESFEELRKLEGLRAAKRAQLREALEAGDDAAPAQAELRRQIAFLENELDIHRRVVDSLSDARGGRGAIAMSDDTRAALESGLRLPDFPDRALDDLSDADLQSSAYYFTRNEDGTFEAVLKADRTAPEITPTAPAARSPAEVSARADAIRAALPNASSLTDEVCDALADIPEATLARIQRANATELTHLSEALTADPTLAGRLSRSNNPYGAIRGLASGDADALSTKLFRERVSGVRGNERVVEAARRSGASWDALDGLSEADLRVLARADRDLGTARQGFRPGTARESTMRSVQSNIDGIGSVDASVRDALRAELAHGHGLSDIPFMLDPAAALRAKFPPAIIPEPAMRQLAACHPDALRALESATEAEIQVVIRLLTGGEPGQLRDVNDILRSYMYKAQKAARRGDGTLEPPANVAGRLDESVDTLARVRDRGFPFGFASRADYDAFMDATRDGLSRRGIDGTPRVQGSAMHNTNPGDIDMEIVVTQAEFDRLAAEFTDLAPAGREARELADHISRGKIPSPYFFPHHRPSLAAEVRSMTRAEDGSGALEVQATLLVHGSDFDLGPFL